MKFIFSSFRPETPFLKIIKVVTSFTLDCFFCVGSLSIYELVKIPENASALQSYFSINNNE